eukprot:Skav236771  [mRNA]  locus=scaffold2707:132067:135193:+ [translate_table: standard]
MERSLAGPNASTASLETATPELSTRPEHVGQSATTSKALLSSTNLRDGKVQETSKRRSRDVQETIKRPSTALLLYWQGQACGFAMLSAGACAVNDDKDQGVSRICRDRPAAPETALLRRAEVKSEDLPKRIAIVIVLLALARVGFYIPLYGFDVDATEERGSDAEDVTGGIGPYITSSIIFQILTTITPSLKALAAGEEGEAGREKYKNYIKHLGEVWAKSW